MIFMNNKTVYLKESAREMIRRCFNDNEYRRILDMTVDAYGLPVKNKWSSNGSQGL